jgi:hypothetical protein
MAPRMTMAMNTMGRMEVTVEVGESGGMSVLMVVMMLGIRAMPIIREMASPMSTATVMMWVL